MKKTKVSNYIGIDLGSNNTRIFLKKRGIIFNEATILAIDLSADNRIVSIGNNAKSIIGKTSENIILKRPIKNGVITDINLVVQFLKKAFEDQGYTNALKNAYLVISCPPNINKTEKDGLITLTKKFGAKYCEIVEDIKLGLLGIDINIYEPTARLVLDLGGGKVSVGIIASNQIIISNATRHGGDYILNEIIKFVRSFYDLSIGEGTADKINSILGGLNSGSERDMLVFGRDVSTGLPKEVFVNNEKMKKLIGYIYSQIANLISETLSNVESDVIKDIITDGVYVIGGGAKTKGLKGYLSNFLKMKVNIHEEPEKAVILGCQKYESKLINNYNGIYNELSFKE